MQKEIEFEPETALFADNGGREIINRIICYGKNFLYTGGMILMEISPDMIEYIKKLGEEKSYSVSILNDYSNLPRIAILN